MGRIIAKRIRGMNWMAKISLILIFTLVFSTFMHQGMWKPKAANAALSSKQGTFVKSTAAGAQSITGLGFQPKAIIFYWSKQTAAGYLASTSGGYGFAAAGAPITMAAVSVQALDAQATTDSNNYHSDAAAIVLQNTASGGAVNNLGTVTAFGADGFTVNWSAAGQADIIHYIALGGTDITNAKVGTTSMFAATGASSVTGVGFQPDTAFLIASSNGITLNTITAGSRTGRTFGFMSDTSGAMTQGSVSYGNRDGRTATGYIGSVWSNTGYENLRATATDVDATWSSWDADGFTMNATVANNGAHNVSWLALKGGQFKLGTLAQRTSTGSQAITGVGFQPNAVLFAGANLSTASGTVNTTAGTAGKQSFGAAAATQSGTWIGTAGSINSDENMYASTTAAITHATSQTTNAQASLTSLDADGFTLNWTADATARNVLYIAMGSATPAGDSVNVADGTDPANYNVSRGSTNNVADSFTMVSTNTLDGLAAVTGVTASFTNSANISGVRLYKDNGVVGTYEAGTDTLLSTGTPGASVSFTGFTENLTTTATNYLILVDISGSATLTQTIDTVVTAVTVTAPDSQGTISDASNPTRLTVVDVPHENVGTALNTAIATSPKTEGVAGVLMQRFQVTSSTSGAGAQDNQLELNSLGIDDLGTATGARTAKVYIDTTSSATLPGTAVLIGSVSSWIGTPTSITLNQGTAGDRTVTNATPRYIYIVYDLPSGATQTVQSSVTSVGAVSPDAGQTGLTLNSNAITLASDPSKIVSCSGCHGYGATFTDGTARNTPTGKFQGSHNTHVASYGKVCSVCHTVPATETSADFAHRDGTITMASPINGNATAAYTKGSSWAQTNTPTAFTGCTNTYCHSNGTSATTPAGSIPANTSTTWGGTTACNSCHGDVNGRPNYTEGSPKANKHQASTHAAQTCVTCHDSVDALNVPNALHVNGAYNIQGSLGYTAGSAALGGTCATPGCHSSINWGGSLGCLDCHNVAQTAPTANTLSGGTVTQRVAIVPSFSLASKHTRSRGTAVTNNDCGVCHMEGTAATGAVNGTYHGNGYVELRDPDLGTTIKGVTHSGTTAAPGVYSSTGTDARPIRFSRNLASATIEADTAAIMVNQCLKCHDAVGAGSATAIVPGGTAGRPFAGTIAANPGSNVLDVAAQFASTNRSFHPVLVRQNNAYAGGTRMVAPWNGVAKSGTTTVYGPLITCWDCHAPNGATGTLTTSGIHGAAVTGTDVVPMRGQTYTTGTTTATLYCIICHAGYTTSADNHGSGSAFSSVNRTGMGGINNLCINCHSSQNNSGQPARPIGAGDAHGYSTRATGAAFPAASNGYGFIRSEGFYGSGYQNITQQVGATTYGSNCTGYNGAGSICSRNGMGTYTPGGRY